MCIKRKLSPHVQIYKFPLTAISSITTRVTGLYLTGLFLGAGCYSLYNTQFVENEYAELSRNYKRIVNYSMLFPTIYHTFGGLRHFIWDRYPQLLKNNKVAVSSFLLYGSSILFTIIGEYVIS